MKTLRILAAVLFFAFFVTALQTKTSAQSSSQASSESVATLSSAGTSVRFDVRVSYSLGSLTVVAPDGRAFRQELKAGASPDFTLMDKQGERLPDGAYTYELRLNTELSAATKEKLKAMRGKDDEPESVRASRKRIAPAELVQSGGFSILNGALMVPGPVEEKKARPTSQIMHMLPPGAAGAGMTKIREHHSMPKPDFVIADDLVVQGSACVGLDCVNNEPFSFDTIRLKENNTRILFMDTSTGTFPTNDWMIRANSSANGGTSFLGFVDQGATSTGSDTGTIVFEVDAGAPSNALRVSSTGNVGLSTGTPVLDLHITTSDTPAHRLEQTNAGGFTAQTWDVAGNEANFFVRDVTSGSRLPFRIRPGAPTSSLDISADGDVGIGTAGPNSLLHLHKSTRDLEIRLTDAGSAAAGDVGVQLRAGTGAFLGLAANGGTAIGIVIDNSNRVGINTDAPTDNLSVNGTASKPGGGTWAVFSDERLKNIKGQFNSGLKALMQLQPLRYEYKKNNALGLVSSGEHIGFGAQAVQKVIPEAVTSTSSGYLQVNSDPIIWTMLNAIKEQQKEIEQLKGQVRHLRAARKRR